MITKYIAESKKNDPIHIDSQNVIMSKIKKKNKFQIVQNHDINVSMNATICSSESMTILQYTLNWIEIQFKIMQWSWDLLGEGGGHKKDKYVGRKLRIRSVQKIPEAFVL